MKDILEKIVDYKKLEVAGRKGKVTVAQLEDSVLFERTCIPMTHYIKHGSKSGIIAEYKRQSPSKGIINDQSTVQEVTNGYVKAGVSGLSVLTDTKFFGGLNEDLLAARAVNYAPILRKDFIIDEYQIIEAKAIGADVILLIGECLNKEEVGRLAAFAQSLGLQVLFELHGEEQVDKITSDINLVGINNRNLKTFEVDLVHSIQLCRKLPNDFVKISESGISDPKTIVELKREGFDGFLIGENFMKTNNPGQAAINFIQEINELETASGFSPSY